MTTGRERGEAGAVAVLFAVCAMVMFVIAALVVDLGLARETRREAQNSADAAALAAANKLYLAGTTPDITGAVAAAKSYALTNFRVTAAAWNTGSCVDTGHLAYTAPGTQCISFDSATAPTTVRVRIPTRDVVTGLGNAAGIDSVPVGAVAEAGVASRINYNCALCFLNSVSAGNGDFTVSGGGIQVNGGISTGPQSHWTATTIGATGTASGGTFTPAVTKTPAFTDPLASLTLPTLTGTDRGSVGNCNRTLQPGVYGTVSLGNNSTCTLSAGKYVITGRWLLGNKSVLQGSGVTLYFTCGTSASPHVCTGSDTTATSGWLDGKNGTVAITSGATGFTDYAIIYDRLNPQPALGLQGNGGTSITGAVYTKNALLDFNGNSCFGFSKGPVIAAGVNDANGNKSCINVINAVDITATSKPGSIALSK